MRLRPAHGTGRRGAVRKRARLCPKPMVVPKTATLGTSEGTFREPTTVYPMSFPAALLAVWARSPIGALEALVPHPSAQGARQ